mgnify:CR=1 FL=1|jgi:hypothetical protein
MTQYRRSFTGRPWNVRFIAVISIVLFLSGCLSPDTPSSAVPWQIQQKMIREAVDQVAPDAFLLSGVVLLETSIYDDQHSLDVSLSYIRPSGELITVVYEDTQITSTLKVLPSRGYFDPSLSSKPLPTEERIANWMQISPSEALAVTLAEGRAFLEEHQSSQDPVLALYTDVEDVFGIPAAWYVSYFAPPHQLRLWVHAQTGEIVGRTNGSLYPTPAYAPPTATP